MSVPQVSLKPEAPHRAFLALAAARNGGALRAIPRIQIQDVCPNGTGRWRRALVLGVDSCVPSCRSRENMLQEEKQEQQNSLGQSQGKTLELSVGGEGEGSRCGPSDQQRAPLHGP